MTGVNTVKIAHFAIVEDPMVTLIAVEPLRTEVFGPIDGDQQLLAKGTIPFQQSALFHGGENITVPVIWILRTHGIEQMTALVITG